MTTEQRAERLSLVEPASLPDRPFSPNRPLIIAAAAAAGLALGLVLALIVEIVLKPIRSPRQLEQLGLPLLGVVPLLKSHKGLKKPGLFRSRGTRLAA
jgi:capsular polysaccharide biosynthesis protein